MKIGTIGSKPSYLNLCHLVSTGFYWFLPVFLQFSDGNLYGTVLRCIGEDQVISNSVRAKQQPYCSREFRNSLAQVGCFGGLFGCDAKFLAGINRWWHLHQLARCSECLGYVMLWYVIMCIWNKMRAALDQRNTVPNYDFPHGFSRFQWNPLDSYPLVN